MHLVDDRIFVTGERHIVILVPCRRIRLWQMNNHAANPIHGNRLDVGINGVPCRAVDSDLVEVVPVLQVAGNLGIPRSVVASKHRYLPF